MRRFVSGSSSRGSGDLLQSILWICGWLVVSTAVVLLLVILLLLLATADDDGVDKDDDDDGAAEVEDEEGCDVEDVEELDRICSKSPGACCVDVLAANMIVSTCVSAILSYTVFLGSLH